MRYTLRQLQVYLATARTENITQAADTLAMSQSAASEALKSLETQFNVKLFDRIGKRLQLNDFGREIRPQVERLLEQAQRLEHSLDRSTASHGSLTVGATLSIGNYLGISMLAEFRGSHPQTRSRLEVANTSVIAEKILNYAIDLGLVEGEINHPDLLLTPWIDDELVIFCAPDYALAGRTLSDEDLVLASWILREEGSGTRQSFDFAMRGLTPSLHIALELQHTEAIKRAVEAGLGIGCLSRITLEDAFRRQTLVPLAAPQRDFRRKLYTVIHREKYLTPGIEAWLMLCQRFGLKYRFSPAKSS
jgi:DNA-binding transcriptional LysR family regulator